MFEKLKNLFVKKPAPVVEAPPPVPQKTPAQLATERGEPYVNIISMDLDPNDLSNGAFELEWNDLFISQLIRAGYQMEKTDDPADLVDRWFTNVCRNVVLETYEQYEAIAKAEGNRVIKSRDLGDGRSEIS